MARSMWTGSLSFGLVNVPVALYSATKDLGIHFRQLDEKTKAPIEIRRVCSKDGKEVAWDEIAHGFDVGDHCVLLTDDELDRLAPEKTRTIDIEAFVDLDDIDPELFDHPYWLVPQSGEGPARAYRLLADVMERADRVAIGRFVLRTREYLVALRVRDGAIALSTMLFADELRDEDGVGDGRIMAEDKPSNQAVAEMTKLVEAMQTDFEPEAYQDCHRKRVQKLIARKRKGGEIDAPDAPETPSAAPDLMAALRESLEKAKAA